MASSSRFGSFEGVAAVADAMVSMLLGSAAVMIEEEGC